MIMRKIICLSVASLMILSGCVSAPERLVTTTEKANPSLFQPPATLMIPAHPLQYKGIYKNDADVLSEDITNYKISTDNFNRLNALQHWIKIQLSKETEQ